MNTLTKIGLAGIGILTALKLVSAKGDEDIESIPANISVVDGSFTTTPSTCPSTGQCTITAKAAWQNTGGTGTFTPAFMIDGIVNASPSPITLGAGETTEYSATVTVSSSISNHKVCPSPNP